MTANPKTSLKIWALLDGRPGNSTQTLGVAEQIGGTMEEKNIFLNKLSRLSNTLLQDRLWGIDRVSKEALGNGPWPDVAIATGRRLAPLLRHIKNKNPGTYIVQLMSPMMSLEPFDLVVLPSHDKREGENILVTLGAPNRVTSAKIAEYASKWRLRLNLHTPVTALLVGGTTDQGMMTPADAEALWQAMQPLRNGSLLVTTSRRTPPLVNAYLKETIKPPHHLFLYGEGENPYLAFLGLADRLVVTADSVSMISEACMTGKPVYVFEPGAAMKPKHRPMLQALEAAGHIKPLSAFDPAWLGGTPLNEAFRVAAYVREKIGWIPDEKAYEPAPLRSYRPAPPVKGRPHLKLVKKK